MELSEAYCGIPFHLEAICQQPIVNLLTANRKFPHSLATSLLTSSSQQSVCQHLLVASGHYIRRVAIAHPHDNDHCTQRATIAQPCACATISPSLP